MKKIISLTLALCLLLAGCGGTPASQAAPSGSAPGSSEAPLSAPGPAAEPVTILIAAAASLEYSLRDELIPMFQEQYGHITVEGAYDSSGKLQAQIEEGLEADLFFSAAQKQMDALNDKGLVDGDSIVSMLENRIVLITPAGSAAGIAGFQDLEKAASIALGDPESVPVGQYAREALTSLGLWDSIQPRVSLGTNVTEVLNWVAEGSADAGIVYATDAATTDKVAVVAEAPEGSLATKVIYPAAIVASSRKKEAAGLFLEFLRSDEAMAVFEQYGFAAP